MRRPDLHRCGDLILIVVVALPVAPLAAGLAILIRLRLGQPILFRQVRTGRDGVPFTLVKFRTMTDALDLEGHPLPDAERLTALGRWLRSTSLDELPELLNVIQGTMALVGPRPLPVRYLRRYTEAEAVRHDVRPGITGWAQVNGRNSTDWNERLALDVWYVENRTVFLDLAILARTIGAVLRRDGISAEGHATMSELRPELGTE